MCVEHEHDPFIKRVSRVNPNMTQTHLTLTYDLFINELVVSGSQIVSNFATPILTRGNENERFIDLTHNN